MNFIKNIITFIFGSESKIAGYAGVLSVVIIVFVLAGIFAASARFITSCRTNSTLKNVNKHLSNAEALETNTTLKEGQLIEQGAQESKLETNRNAASNSVNSAGENLNGLKGNRLVNVNAQDLENLARGK